MQAGTSALREIIDDIAPTENAIVLGLALEDGKATEDLQYRLDAAQKYIAKNPSSKLILTGGNPGPDGRTEVEVMCDILLECGVPEESMILENQADTTEANFRNTAQMIDPHEPVVLISSNYHMERAVSIAHQTGFDNVYRMPARSARISYGVNVLWETIIDINNFVESL